MTCRSGLDDLAGAFLAEVAQLGEHAVVRTVGGNFELAQIGAAAVAEEVVARRDAPVHARRIEAPRGDLGLVGGKHGRSKQRRRGGGAQENGLHGRQSLQRMIMPEAYAACRRVQCTDSMNRRFCYTNV